MAKAKQPLPTEITGIYAQLNGKPVKMTVTLAHVSVTEYHAVHVIMRMSDIPDDEALAKRLKSALLMLSKNDQKSISFKKLFDDLKLLIKATEHVNANKMHLIGGQVITMVALSAEPVVSDDGFAEFDINRKEWWSHPSLEPIVQSIQEQVPNFSPWKCDKDILIHALTRSSSLL